MVDVPKKITIGAQVFEVIQRSSKEDGMLNDGNYGYTLDVQNMIVLDEDLHETKKRVVLMHELLHASRMVFEPSTKPTEKDDYDAWEHHFINIFENSVIMMLKDNPKLVEWLLGK
jgi:Zn-dependent peptidase ImmA (M78 family)